MPHNDLAAMSLFVAYFIVTGLPPVLLKVFFHVPFEVMRKMLHFVATLSIFPLLYLFENWYMAALTAALFALVVYPALKCVETTSAYRRIAVERRDGEFKHSLIIVEASYAILITIFWGLLGAQWKYVALVAVMAWGFGDAAAALIGKAFGRRRIRHRWIEGAKTIEGTQAMYLTAGLSIFLTLLIHAGQPWQISLIVALLVAPVSALVELFSRGGMDTLTVPISTGFAVLSVMSLFASLGS